ncbi:MAG: VF530 family protein [Desulfuromonadaceae bacterium]|nr:VF530 family protein [Desulfuromonadaceae bacterium]
MSIPEGAILMTVQNSSDPLHGITLKTILSELVSQFGWEEMAKTIDIRCFTHEPSISSSLKFLRRTPWARDKVEEMYLRWKM